MKGEKEAAYQINFHYAALKNWIVINDLPLEFNEFTAQIDHLLINRFLEIYVCESKNFNEGIAINDQGEFSAFYQRKPYGIPSHIEQNSHYITLLKKPFDSGAVNLPIRLDSKIKPTLFSLILIANSTQISPPRNGLSI
ncbi:MULTISPECIES: nuclease-related domain-containing protein [Neisseria]|uniref:Nuclease-related domain protein n=1 Tax=Neisseria musculi TaxID=1815583 RepID=A0A7H1MA78_9NEIS|nr:MULTISPECIES: nuclease-related domain-containing protein [Neisseria]MBF0803434.1 NERD domain-containing protein [Neisseria sp. 19428wB4_WF04]QNT58543.1 nuclease-related domain protein [Neisseria musculi]TFU43939.1 NERD domain-containing protein [Neisseria sp. WF04]